MNVGNTEPVYAYPDILGQAVLTVSECPLPSSMLVDQSSQLLNFAKSYNADQSLQVDGITVYIAAASNGAQNVICVKDDLLLLISSTVKLSDSSWTTYIRSLR